MGCASSRTQTAVQQIGKNKPSGSLSEHSRDPQPGGSRESRPGSRATTPGGLALSRETVGNETTYHAMHAQAESVYCVLPANALKTITTYAL